MSPRPAIFVSAVSRELRSARQLVANTLTFLGYDPEWQDIFGTEGGDLRAMLRRRIDACKAVVQLVGTCYGAEPPVVDEQFGRVSYTQFEALYALSKRKKVWYLVLDETFPSDPHEAEDEVMRALQAAYRAKTKADIHLDHALSTREGLEASVLKLREELNKLRRGIRRWAALVAGLLVVSVGLSVWLLQSQQSSDKQMQSLQEKFDKLQEGVNAFAEVQNRVRQEQPGQKPAEIEQRTYEILGKQLGLDPAMLKAQLPVFAQELKRAPRANAYIRANAAYVEGDYNEAERLALSAADQAEQANPPNKTDEIKALELAAWAAEKRVEYSDALNRLREAEQLTDRTGDPLEWARVQLGIANILNDQGRYDEAQRILSEVAAERERALGLENPDTLSARNQLVRTLYHQGKYLEAESECREILKLREKLLGPENPDTLTTRFNLAAVLDREAKYQEAQTDENIVIEEREKVLGAENPDTLAARNNLGVMLADEGRYGDAEAEDRAVIELEEKVLGPEHPDTLGTRTNLAHVLDREGNYAEAETDDRQLVALDQKVLGAEHPDTLETRNDLANVLADQGKCGEAETEFRAVLELREKVLRTEHPDTLETCFDLARCLRSEGKTEEASALAERAVDGARKVLGPEHPDTKKYEQLRNGLAASSVRGGT
jgi:tetratricopeptide (TPR) repeat protein